MEYSLLTQTQMGQIAHQKLLDLEAEHARLELDVRLSLATGIQNDAVAQAQYQLDVLVQQIATLTSWITPPPPDDGGEDDAPEPEPEPAPAEAASSNGREPIQV